MVSLQQIYPWIYPHLDQIKWTYCLLIFSGASIQSLAFPSRRLFGNRSTNLAHERKRLLQKYLNALIQTCANIDMCALYQNASKKALIQFSSFFEDTIIDNSDINHTEQHMSSVEQGIHNSIPNSPRSDNSEEENRSPAWDMLKI